MRLTRRQRRVYVLGAGPAGLLAAQGAEDAGFREVALFTMPNDMGFPARSILHGCQYLHRPIPGVVKPEDHVEVQYRLQGSVGEYRQKVYGDSWNGAVSPDEFGPESNHLAWDLREVYTRLWAYWLPRITSMQLTPTNVTTFANDPYAIVLSTVPAPALCRRPEEHKFPTQDVWAMGSAPGVSMPYCAPENVVQCNGLPAPRWYRAATVFGQSTLEWPSGVKPPIRGIAAVRKPLSTDCYCWLTKSWHRLGRYGKWTKGVLAHTAYFEAHELLR